MLKETLVHLAAQAPGVNEEKLDPLDLQVKKDHLA